MTYFQYLGIGLVIAIKLMSYGHLRGERGMLKITRTANGEVVFRLVGSMGADNIGEVETLLNAEASGRRILLDLGDLTLVDQGVVSFLGSCKANGIEIKNSPAYIREWMKQEKS